MGLWIDGEFTKEELKFIENHSNNDVWTWVATPEELDEEDDKPGAYYEKGSLVLSHAASLLEILDNQRENKISNIREVAYKQRLDEKNELFNLTVAEVQEIYQLIEDLPQRITEIIDPKWHEIRPEKSDLVRRASPSLFKYKDENVPWSLYAEDQIKQLVKFFELAIKKKREIQIC